MPDALEAHELLAQTHEATGGAAAAQTAWLSLTEILARRGDRDRVREVLQRHVHAGELGSIGEEDARAAALVRDSTRCDEPELGCEPDPNDTSSQFTPVEVVDRGEAQTHQDLAIAFMQMNAWQRARQELEYLRRFEHREVEALSLMARCAAATGCWDEAVNLLGEGLEKAGDGVYASVPLCYELAEALLEAQRPAEALDAFRKVAAQGPGFRDVDRHIAELAAVLTPDRALASSRNAREPEQKVTL
jgi:tetratricopeptide (TPR) repeat protein